VRESSNERCRVQVLNNGDAERAQVVSPAGTPKV
jgi:hypothetical protein